MRATSGKGFVRLMAEHEWLHLYYNYQMPVHIFRCAGIYGPRWVQCGTGWLKAWAAEAGRWSDKLAVGGFQQFGRGGWQSTCPWHTAP